MAVIRISYISKGLTKISQEIIEEIANRKATHVTLHANDIRSLDIKSALDLKRLVDLDLSSNSLHSGYSLTNFGVDKGLSMLQCCCHSLLKLNFQSNAFTTKSFEAFLSSSPILSNLTTLDISHNSIAKLPLDLNQKYPSLRNLSVHSNQIKSLSSLLQVLHQFRGQLERLHLNKKGSSSNPVCSAKLYREKVIFVLGSGLLQLDSRIVSEDERKQVRARLAIYSTSRSNAEKDVDVDRLVSVDQEITEKEHHLQAHAQYVPPSLDDNSINDENNANSADIEHRVEYLSNLIEKQAHITSGLIEVTQQSAVDMNRDEHDDNSRNDALEEQVQADNAATISNLQKSSACILVQLTLLKDKRRQSLLRMTFSQWMLSAKFKAKFKKSEIKWRERANDVVAKAVKQEEQKSAAALNEAAKTNKLAEERASHFTARIKELEAEIEFEQSKSATHARNADSDSDRLRKDLQQAHAAMKRIEQEGKNNVRLAAVDLESTRDELHRTQEELQKEKADNARLDLMYKELTKTTQEVRESSTAHTVELHDLKLELATKDATIKQLKTAFEQAANRAASDRSKCEHALAGERRKGEMVKSYSKKFKSLEADKQKLVAIRVDLEAAVAEKDTQIVSMQKALHEHAGKNANLTAVIEEKDCKINSLERRLKYISDERDDFHHQLTECKSVRTQLQSQLDRTNNELMNSKRSSTEVHQFETMKLQQTLDALRHSSQLREQELSTTLKVLRRECQEKTGKQTKLIKSLGHKLEGCEAREADMERSYRSELQKLKSCQEHELKVLKDTLANEKKLRLDAEQKIAALEASQSQQQSKMKNAIADLAKEFTIS